MIREKKSNDTFGCGLNIYKKNGLFQAAVLICNPGDHYRGSTAPAGYARLSIQGNALRIGAYKRVADQQWEEGQQVTQPVYPEHFMKYSV